MILRAVHETPKYEYSKCTRESTYMENPYDHNYDHNHDHTVILLSSHSDPKILHRKLHRDQDHVDDNKEDRLIV